MKSTSEFKTLLKTPAFVSRIISIIMDEAHCLTECGDFRPEYQELDELRYVLPATVPLYIASAPLTKSTLSDISRLLHLQQDKLVTVRCSSDRPNIRIGVRKIKYAQKGFADLAFLIPDGFKEDDPPPPKFLIFFDDITESINATKSLWKRLPRNLTHKIKWFNVDMSTTYKVTEMKNLANGDTWGLCTSSSFGMVSTGASSSVYIPLIKPRILISQIYSSSSSGGRPVISQCCGIALAMQREIKHSLERPFCLQRRIILMRSRLQRWLGKKNVRKLENVKLVAQHHSRPLVLPNVLR